MHRLFRCLALFLTLLPLISLVAKQSRHVGQSFILTLPETTNKKRLRSWLEQARPAGVMLLASHVQNRKKTAELTTFLQEQATALGLPPLIIAIDWEGGIVSRPTEMGDFHSIPSPWALAQVGRQACFQAAFLIGTQMRSVGITMNFAPSLDLFGKHILATRCFAAEPATVAECGIAFTHGLIAAGVTPVVKHFPGLGSGTADTHEAAVKIAHTDVSTQPDTQPFLAALRDGNCAIMATHATCAEFGPFPITRSAQAVHFLRQQRKDALLITDDFCMSAASMSTTQEEAIAQSLAAGYDLVIFSGKPDEQIAIIKNLNDQQTKQGNSKKFLAKKHANSEQLHPAEIDEEAFAHQLACSYLQTIYVPPLKGKPVILVTTDLPSIRPPEKWFLRDKKSFLNHRLADEDARILQEFIINPKAADDKAPKSFQAQWDKIKEAIQAHPDAIIITQTFFYADGPWNTTQRQWLNKLKPFSDRICAVSLGHPEEQAIFTDAQIIPLGSFHEPLLKNLAQRLARPVEQGIDVFINELEKHLTNKRFGLLCNKSSLTSENQFLPDLLFAWSKDTNKKSSLTRLFSPEHGLLGTHAAYDLVPSEQTSQWGCPVESLHGARKKPSPAMLKDIDVMLIDLPDVGMRCFTYLSTLDLTIEACAEQSIPVILLDKINPLADWGAAGPGLDEASKSFIGRVQTQFMHGTTIGEIAHQCAKKYGCNLIVINNKPYEHQTRCWLYAPPSPNLMSIDHMRSYPCSLLFEGTNYSEGRGTKYPFLQIGAPWVDGKTLAAELNTLALPGVYFEPITFAPKSMPGIAEKPKHANNTCNGVFIHLLNTATAQPTKIAQALITTCFRLYQKHSKLITSRDGIKMRYTVDLLWGNDNCSRGLLQPIPPPMDTCQAFH
jgi:uncharacterized protein YbbC (DUF1343 family)/beta-glucosidase-like glycosyl hydrolase